MTGIAPDLLSSITKTANLNISSVQADSREGLIEQAKSGQLDLIMMEPNMPGLAEHYTFTRPVSSFPLVIIQREESDPIVSMQQLRLRKVAVIRGRALNDILTGQRLGLNLVPFNRPQHALAALRNGSVDAYFDTVPTLEFFRRPDNLDLRAIAPTPYSLDIAIGVKNELKELAPILDRIVANVSAAEKRTIVRSWLNVRVQREVDIVLIAQIFGGVLLVSLLIVLFYFRWNQQLAHEVQNRRKLEKALKNEIETKNVFFSIIAHDLRSPFTSLMGMTKAMNALGHSLSGEQMAEYAANVNRSAERVYALVENLLEWARMQMSGADVRPSNVHISELTRETFEVFHSLAAEKNVALELGVVEGVAFCDRDMIFTVIRNLVNNAIKFTPKGGKVVISACRKDGSVQVSVTDTGAGMDSATQSKLFSLDHNSSQVGTDGEKGTGLGLPLCADLIERNSGRIWVESSPGAGSTFYFALPEATQ